MTQTHFYEPAAGHRLPHDPLKAIIAPRPIGWISSVSAAGVVNLAPYSFFNMVSDEPPMVMFSSNGWKDSVRNVSDTGAFVANLAVRFLAEAMNASSAAVPPEVDEMAMAGIAKAPSVLVAPPRVAEAPAALECKCVLHPAPAWSRWCRILELYGHRPDRRRAYRSGLPQGGHIRYGGGKRPLGAAAIAATMPR